MTIYALSTGPGVSGIAVVRVSGKEAAEVVKQLTGDDLPAPRVAVLKKLTTPQPVATILQGLHKGHDIYRHPFLLEHNTRA